MKTIDGCKSTRLRMGKLSLGAAILVGLAGCGSDTNTDTNIDAIDPQQPVEDWVMVWSDEFDGASIDSSKWTHEVDCNGGGNQEQQCYTDSAENSFVADGMLNIVAKTAPEGSAKPYTSARLNTKEHMDWKYGRFEMRAKLPSGQGSWPAFWMLPTDEVYGGWPRSGEIDIIESVNLKAGTTDGGSEAHVYGTLHYGKVWPDNSSSGQPYLLPDEINPADDFHTYAIEWQEGEIRWYVDDYLYATQRSSELRYNAEGEAIGLSHRGWFSENFNIVTGELETQWSSAPYDEKFHLILNFAVGGNWPSSVNDTGIDAEVFADGQTFAIDYVRVYECASNPDTGKGCETVRPGYDSLDDALVEGKAPNPPLPIPTETANLTVFEDAENPSWPMWDCCGGSTPTVETDDADHGATAEFTIGAQPTVMGFITRRSGGGDDSPYNASGIKDDGVISFDMKVTSVPADGSAAWNFKVESSGGPENSGTAVTLALTDSNEGAAPVTGQWQTYTFSLQALFDAGLDLSDIDVLMVFPDWGKGEGAVYRLDNVMIGTLGDSPELTIFENNYNPDWPMFDCCAGSTPTEESDDAEHGITAEFTIGDTAEPTVLGFSTRDGYMGSGMPFNGSAILEEGVISFDVKIVTAPSDASAVWKFKVEASGGTSDGNSGSALELDLATGSAGMAPTVGEWRSYSFTLQSLFDAGLDVSDIDTLMIFPEWGKGNGAVYRVDNVKIHDPNGTSNPAPSSELKLYQDTTATDWVLWDCCGGSIPTQENDDADHGSTAEFSIGSEPTVMGFNARSGIGGGAPFDASALLATGVIKFDMKVVTAPSDSSAEWNFKIEAAGGVENGAEGSAVTVGLADSNEGVSPVTGTWQTYTFTLQSLFDAGLDISAIDVVMIFPDWGKGEGAVYRIDNAVIGAP